MDVHREQNDCPSNKPITVYEEQAKDKEEDTNIDRIAANRKHTVSHKLVGFLFVNADPERIAEGYEGERNAAEARRAKRESQPAGRGDFPKGFQQWNPHRQAK